MRKLISMIVPVYNGERWLELLFRQFEEQTYSNLELVLVDDGSTDNTLFLCHDYAQKKNNVSIYHKENGGPSSARNYGLRKAKGEYIVFADVDDRIYPEYVEYLYKLIIETDADMSVCSYIKMKEKDDYDKYLKNKNKNQYFFNNKQIMEQFCYRKLINGYSCLKLIKSDIAKQITFPEDIVYGEDFIYVYDVLKRCKNVVCGKQIEYIYIQFKNSSTHKKKDDTIKYQKAWIKHLEVLEDVKDKYPDCYGGMLEKCYLLAINNTTRIFDKKRDRDFLLELYYFIRNNSAKVFVDSKNKVVSRLLGLLGMINVELVCYLCKTFFSLQEKIGLTFRRTR